MCLPCGRPQLLGLPDLVAFPQLLLLLIEIGHGQNIIWPCLKTEVIVAMLIFHAKDLVVLGK